MSERECVGVFRPNSVAQTDGFVVCRSPAVSDFLYRAEQITKQT